MSFLRKQESSLLGPQKSPSPGLAFGQAGLSRQGRGGLFHSAKCYRKTKSYTRWLKTRDFVYSLRFAKVNRPLAELAVRQSVVLAGSIGTRPFSAAALAE